MTREETIQVLSLLKAAYPTSYRGLSKQEANGVISVWAMQFSSIPVEIVLIAINKLISSNKFAPTVSEVKTRIKHMFGEAEAELFSDAILENLSDKERKVLECLVSCSDSIKEPTLCKLLCNQNDFVMLEEYEEAEDK